MDTRIALRGDDAAGAYELDSLWHWLAAEPPLSGRVRPCTGGPAPGPGTGGAVRGVLIAHGSEAADAVVRALPIWLRQRRPGLELEVARGDRRVTVKASRGREAERLLREILDDGRRSEREDRAAGRRELTA